MSTLQVKTIDSFIAEGKKPEILFWVGSAGSYDDRAKKISRAFVKLLNQAKVVFAVLGPEESCTGDVAKRAGNEFLFQMQALMNIEVLNGYEITRIVTCDPHSYNTLKNEYPSLGGTYEVQHHTQFLKELVDAGRLTIAKDTFKDKKITFHDPCYLGRANKVYDAPRNLLQKTTDTLVEMSRNKSKALCCGAGGAQMFKEPEKGDMDINVMRTAEAIQTKAQIIATGCPYCNTMMTDGLKAHKKENEIEVLDVAEVLAKSQGL